MQLVDLSHAVEDGMVTYPGLPGPAISDHLTREASRARYSEGTEFHIGRIDMIANTGTYVDAPFHRFEDGIDLAGLPLEWVAALPGRVVDRRDGGRRIDADALADVDVEGRAVLFQTGADLRWGTPGYADDAPFLTGAAAEALVDGGAVLVGIDSLNVDDHEDGRRPVHTTQLAAGVPVVEHLRGLEQLDGVDEFTFFAVPVKVAGLGTFPVRAFALVS